MTKTCRGCTLIYSTHYTLTYNFTLTHGPGSWTLQEKGVKSTRNRRTGRLCRPVLQLPTGQSCSLQTCWDSGKMILAHMAMNRGTQKQNERGQNVEKGSGHDMAKGGHGRQTQPAEQATAGNHSRRTLRPAQASRQTASRWPASQQTTTAADVVGQPLAVQCR